jgi:hypothetical protein
MSTGVSMGPADPADGEGVGLQPQVAVLRRQVRRADCNAQQCSSQISASTFCSRSDRLPGPHDDQLPRLHINHDSSTHQHQQQSLGIPKYLHHSIRLLLYHPPARNTSHNTTPCPPPATPACAALGACSAAWRSGSWPTTSWTLPPGAWSWAPARSTTQAPPALRGAHNGRARPWPVAR